MARISQDGQPEIASGIATLGPKYKLQIPADCISIIAWPLDSPVELISELFETGCVRLHLASEILPGIQARRDEIQQGKALNRLQLLGAMDDKYRAVSFYTKGTEKSVTFEERVAVYLGVLPEDNRIVFVEGTKKTIDVMSLTYRNRRLQLLMDSITA